MTSAKLNVSDTHTTPATLLHRVMLVDGALCAAFGLLLAAAAGPLADLFDLPTMLLRLVGVGLLPWAAFVLFIATRQTISRSLALDVIVGNALWVAASLLLLVNDRVDPSAIGIAFVLAQAALVAVIATVQYKGLRNGSKP